MNLSDLRLEMIWILFQHDETTKKTTEKPKLCHLRMRSLISLSAWKTSTEKWKRNLKNENRALKLDTTEISNRTTGSHSDFKMNLKENFFCTKRFFKTKFNDHNTKYVCIGN